jgi:hypothetical protein
MYIEDDKNNLEIPAWLKICIFSTDRCWSSTKATSYVITLFWKKLSTLLAFVCTEIWCSPENLPLQPKVINTNEYDKLLVLKAQNEEEREKFQEI